MRIFSLNMHRIKIVSNKGACLISHTV